MRIIASRLPLLLHSIYIAFGFTILRAIVNILTKSPIEKYIKKKEVSENLKKIQEELWLVLFGSVIGALSTYLIFISENTKHCNIYSQSECYVDLERVDVGKDILLYYMLEIGWYLGLLIKSIVGVGRYDSKAMDFHHIITLMVVVLSFCTGFTKIGVLTFFVFNISNPMLHLSKLMNYLELKTTRIFTFALFALTFFVTRVVCLPLIVIRSTLYGVPAQASKSEFENDVYYSWLISNIILISLWLLNIYWLFPILRVMHLNIAGKWK